MHQTLVRTYSSVPFQQKSGTTQRLNNSFQKNKLYLFDKFLSFFAKGPWVSGGYGKWSIYIPFEDPPCAVKWNKAIESGRPDHH